MLLPQQETDGRGFKMFFVNDTIEARHAKIRTFLAKEPVIAVLLATADFEWTVRRAIAALGRNPTRYIHETLLKNVSGLERYREVWKREVGKRLAKDLSEVVPDWTSLKQEAFGLRHRLIHGAAGTVGISYARVRVETILAASRAIKEFADANSEPIYGRKIIRLNARG